MLAIPRNVCALRNHPWQHGSGKLVKSRMHCKFRWNFCFHRSLYNDLSQSDTWRGTSGRKENTNPAEPDSTVLRWKSFQISNLKDFILDCWKLFSTSKIPPKSRSSNFCIFSIFSVSTATLRLLTFFPPQVFTFATIFSRRWEPLFIQGACYPALGTCKASKLAVAWKMKTWLSRDPFFEPPPLSNLTSFRHGILPFQLKSQKKKTYEIWYPDWCW